MWTWWTKLRHECASVGFRADLSGLNRPLSLLLFDSLYLHALLLGGMRSLTYLLLLFGVPNELFEQDTGGLGL